MKYSLISVISCALKTVLPLAKSGAHNLAKYLSSLQFSLSTSLQKLKFGEKLRIQVSDVFFLTMEWGRIEEVGHLTCDFCKFVPRIFVHFSVLSKPHARQ